MLADADPGRARGSMRHRRAPASGVIAWAASSASCSGPIAEHQLGQRLGEARLQRHRRAGSAGASGPSGRRGAPPPACTPCTAAAGRTAGPAPPAARGPPRPRPRPRAAAGRPSGRAGSRRRRRNSLAWSRSQSSPMRPDVRDELVGDLAQRDLGDVELVLGDQRSSRSNGPSKLVAGGPGTPRARTAAPRPRRRHGVGRLARSPRPVEPVTGGVATGRLGHLAGQLAVGLGAGGCVGAKVVIGWPATVTRGTSPSW